MMRPDAFSCAVVEPFHNAAAAVLYAMHLLRRSLGRSLDREKTGEDLVEVLLILVVGLVLVVLELAAVFAAALLRCQLCELRFVLGQLIVNPVLHVSHRTAQRRNLCNSLCLLTVFDLALPTPSFNLRGQIVVDLALDGAEPMPRRCCRGAQVTLPTQ